jgi:hypothetical protein
MKQQGWWWHCSSLPDQVLRLVELAVSHFDVDPPMKKLRRPDQQLLDFLESDIGFPLKLRAYGPAVRRIQVAEARDYPREGMTTLVTLGNARELVTMWRGLDVGYELTLTTTTPDAMFTDTLANAVLANLVTAAKGERRRPIEYDGVYAPGYPPHLYFTDEATCTPKLSGRKRVGSAWVHFLAAIPIDDAELRDYDRSVPKFRAKLKKNKRLAEYPRR